MRSFHLLRASRRLPPPPTLLLFGKERKMEKEEIIERYGEAEYARKLAQRRARYKANKEAEKARVKKYDEEHPEQVKARAKKYREEHPEEVRAIAKKCREEHPEAEKARSHEKGRRGGKYYDKQLEYQHTGLQGDKNRIRVKHANQYKPYKDIIAPESQIHHEWVPDTSEYRGVALVEKDAHMHGFVDVIEILDGSITLLTEEEVKRGKKKK